MSCSYRRERERERQLNRFSVGIWNPCITSYRSNQYGNRGLTFLYFCLMQRSTKAGVLQMKTRKIQKKNLLQAICSNQLGYIHKQFEDLEETNTENVNEQ